MLSLVKCYVLIISYFIEIFIVIVSSVLNKMDYKFFNEEKFNQMNKYSK